MRIGDVVQLTEPPMPQLATGLCASTAWRIAQAPRVATLQSIACVSRVWGPAGARPSYWLRGQLTATKHKQNNTIIIIIIIIIIVIIDIVIINVIIIIICHCPA